MIRSPVFQIISVSKRMVSIPRASIHMSSMEMAKKKTDPPAAPATKKTPASKAVAKSGSDEGYTSGEVFFGHNAYSFYDIENDMEKNRVKQPSSLNSRLSFSS